MKESFCLLQRHSSSALENMSQYTVIPKIKRASDFHSTLQETGWCSFNDNLLQGSSENNGGFQLTHWYEKLFCTKHFIHEENLCQHDQVLTGGN